MSQLQEYLDKPPSETQSLLGRNYEQLMNLIVQGEGWPPHKPAYIEPKTRELLNRETASIVS